MDQKSSTRPVFISSLVLALTVAVIALSLQNQALRQDVASLRASSASLRDKYDRLRAKNLELVKVIEKNAALVKSVEEQKKTLKSTMEAVKKENEAVQYEMKKAEAQMNAAVEEKTYLEDMLIHKTREIESLKKTAADSPAAAAPSAAVAEASKSAAGISDQIRQKEAEIQKLSEQNRALSEKLDRLYQVTTSQISEINVAKIALEETVTGARDTIDDEWNTVNLGSINAGNQGAAPAPKAPARPSGPKTEGKVLAVNETHGFVVVDLGKVDNLSSGTGLVIVREGKNIADLSVLEIRDVMAACNVKNLAEGQKIRVNDAVRIQK